MQLRGPKVKFDKDLLVSKSVEFIDEYGVDKISVRNLANHIGCSTQPIFRLYGSIEELLEDVYRSIEKEYDAFIMKGMREADMPFLGMGLAYINFARQHPNFFYVLFMRSNEEKASLLDYVQSSESDEVITEISRGIGLSQEACRLLLRDLWLLSHGIATMFYTKQVSYQDEEIKEILGHGFLGMSGYLKSKEIPNEKST